MFDPAVRAPRVVPVFNSNGEHVHDVDIDDLDAELESGAYTLYVDLQHHAWLRLKHDDVG